MKTRAPLLAIATLAATLATASAQNPLLVLQNGIDQHIDVPSAPTLTPASGITVEAWVTYDGSTLGSGFRWPTIVRQNVQPQLESFILRVGASNTQNTNLEWTVVTASGRSLLGWSFTAGRLTTLTHIAATYDGTVQKIFIDGVEVASRPGNGQPIVNRGGLLRIGNGDTVNAGAETWNGTIDELRIWPFARTAAQIQATMNLELSGMPGEVSTWNLNGDGSDSSGGNHGQPNVANLFAPSTLALTPTPLIGTANYGTATAGCSATPTIAINQAPRVGSASFAFTCVRGTATGGGVFALSTVALPTPINVAGASVWVSPAGALILPVVGGTLGTIATPLPIPNAAALVGQVVNAQYFLNEPSCTTPLFASDALAVRILP